MGQAKQENIPGIQSEDSRNIQASKGEAPQGSSSKYELETESSKHHATGLR